MNDKRDVGFEPLETGEENGIVLTKRDGWFEEFKLLSI